LSDKIESTLSIRGRPQHLWGGNAHPGVAASISARHGSAVAPDASRLHTQVIGLRPGRDDQLYRLPDGQQLIGQTLWLRAEEIGGPRVLNYRFEAER